jgi:hypothetical protein
MARLFDGINDCLTATVDLAAAPIISVAFWLWRDAFAVNDSIALEFMNAGSVGGFTVDAGSAYGGGTTIVAVDPTGGNKFAGYAWGSDAAWHQYLLVFNLTADTIVVYVDGSVDPPLSSSGTTTGTFKTTSDTLFFMCRNAASLFLAGRLAEVAIWTSALSAGDATNLGVNKYAPPLVAPGSLLHYWKLEGSASPEPDGQGSADATVTGAVSTTHPPGIVYSLGPTRRSLGLLGVS